MSGVGVRSPSGEQHEIVCGPHRAIVTEVGATLRHYSVNDVEILDGFGADEVSPAGRGQVLAPWPNRLDRGEYTFDVVRGQAALNEPEHRNAIHGLVRWLPWGVASRSSEAIELGCTLAPQPGYPWFLELGVEYRLTAEGLEVSIQAQNTSTSPAPFGIGFHPYLAMGGPIDEAMMSIPASTRLVTDERGLPTGDEPVTGTAFDYTSSRSIGTMKLDTCYAQMIRSDDGLVRARVSAPERDRDTTIWADERFPYLMVYTGDTLEPPPRRRCGIAVEPMTCPPNAFATGSDVVRLIPGEAWRARWGIDVSGMGGGGHERT